ncbi:MAG: transglycosylase SLT domain-containing protein [Ignavibacteriales bacterium]|nr:transglycosylase SLT domain-containing protein [Ignavibacteriales bacterium]
MDELKLKITNPLKHLENSAEVNSRFSPEKKEKLATAAKDFESLMTQMMLKSMNQTTGGLFGEEGYGGDTMDTIFESEISKYMTKSKSLGIAETIYKKITGEDLPNLKVEYPGVNKTKINDFIRSYSPDTTNSVKPSGQSLERLDKFEPIINEAADSFGVSPNIIKSIILAESAGNEKARSSANAKGLMQLIDSTASNMGVKNVWDPTQNIQGGTKYFSKLLRQYDGDLNLALAAYNAGPGNVDKYNGVPPFNETQTYITRVLGYLKHFEE